MTCKSLRQQKFLSLTSVMIRNPNRSCLIHFDQVSSNLISHDLNDFLNDFTGFHSKNSKIRIILLLLRTQNSVTVPPRARQKPSTQVDQSSPPQNSVFVGSMGGMALIPESPPRRSRSAADLPALIPPSESHTPRSSRATSLHSAVDLRVCVPSPRTSRAASLHSTMDMSQHVQVHVRGSGGNISKPRSPRRLTMTNV